MPRAAEILIFPSHPPAGLALNFSSASFWSLESREPIYAENISMSLASKVMNPNPERIVVTDGTIESVLACIRVLSCVVR